MRKFRLKKHTADASIALITVIIVSAILLAIGTSLVISSMDLTMSSKNALASTYSYSLRRTCLEEAMYKLRYDSSYSIGITVNTEKGTCTATILPHDTEPDMRFIDITTQYDNYTTEETKTVDLSQNPFEIVD